MIKKISIICVTSLLVSCASHQYIIDPKSSTNPENFYADKMECENISEQESYSSNIGWGALKSGLLGAIASGALAYAGFASGNVSVQNSAIIGAGGGIVTGIQLDSKNGGKDFVNRSSASASDYFMINTNLFYLINNLKYLI